MPRTLQERDKYAALIDKGPYAPESITFLRTAGFAAAITKGDDELAQEAEGPRIDIRATFIGARPLGIGVRAHLFIVYTSSEGKQTYFRGGPDDGPNPITVCDVGDYEPAALDWDPSAPKVTLLKGDKAKAKVDGLHEAASRIDALNVPYSGYDVKLNKGGLGGLEAIVSGENCNSTAWTLLKRAGVPTKKPSGLHPGWGHVLGGLKGQGTGGAMPAKEATTGTAALINGKPTVTVQVFADRVGTEKLGTLAGGTAIERIDTDVVGVTKIKFGPANALGWVKDSAVVDAPKPRKAGRQFWVAGKANAPVAMINSRGEHTFVDGQRPIQVLDDDFVVGKGGPVNVRYTYPYKGAPEVDGTINGKDLTDVDPKTQPVDVPMMGVVGDKPKGKGKDEGPIEPKQPRPMAAVTTNKMIPLFEQDGSRHRLKGINEGKVRTVTPTGETDGVMVEFVVEDPHVRAWMPAGDWKRLFGKDYPA